MSELIENIDVTVDDAPVATVPLVDNFTADNAAPKASAVGTALGLLPFFISSPWRILALVLLLAAYYLACCAAAALLYHAEGRLNRRSLAGIFGFPIFMVSWMPVNWVACFTPPPRWKEIRHTRGMDRPDHSKE